VLCVALLSHTVPKGFKLNPAPPNAPQPGKQNAQDNEWLSDREREKEREERLAYAARTAAPQQENTHASRPSTASMRTPVDLAVGARPYSAKPLAARDADASSPYARAGSGAASVISVQAYANSIANRTPPRAITTAADVSRTGSASSNSKFVSKVKDATSAVADEQQHMAQRVGAPSQQMLYPTAFKGSRYVRVRVRVCVCVIGYIYIHNLTHTHTHTHTL
jgi:hypothetical protein